MKNNDLLEDLKAFRTPICEGLNAKIPYTDELADYLTNKGYRKQVEGEWVWIGDTTVMCTVCGKCWDSDDNADAGLSSWRFCPNCGAKMKGEKHD